MSVKQQLLTIFEKNRDCYISGEELAAKLSVSRAAVWKAVKVLQTEGYQIQAVKNRGYALLSETDILSSEGIRPKLLPKYQDVRVVVEKKTDSTNTFAKSLAVSGTPHGTVVLAEEQTSGRGRMGRSFYSPKGSGLYLSMVLRPNLQLSNAVLLTTAASVATSLAIETVTGKETKIKWVNDLFYEGKKICGILTEAVTDFESGTVESVIVGIGVNFFFEDLPNELKGVAGSLYDKKPDVTRNALAAEIINNLLSVTDSLSNREFLDEYRRRSNVLGKEIMFLENSVWSFGQALEIDESGGLVVELLDGTKKTLRSGEVSLRVQK